MSNYKFNPEYLYQNTNKGLDIIFKYCPEARGLEKTNKLFKLREEEDTASASLIEKKDCWVVKDFGDKGYSPIELCRYFTGFSFIEALRYLYDEFNLANGTNIFKADNLFKTDPSANLDFFEVIETDEYKHLDLVGRFVNEKLCLEYDFIPVKQYSFVFDNKKTNERTICTISSTENFPIFAYKGDGWFKIYQPLDKKYKHSFIGKKPQRHVYGLQRLRNIFQETIDNFNLDIDKADKNGEIQRAEALRNERDAFKIDSVIICSGGSDGLGVASLGYNVIWFNSESEQLNYEEYKQLQSLCHEIYNLPDIDKPGTKYGYQVAEMFWNLKSIWLPENIKIYGGKDFRDWLKRQSKLDLKGCQFQFANLLKGALKMKFFERNPKTRTLKIKPSYLHYFLKVKGFYLYYPEKVYINRTSEQECIFIRIDENIVTQLFANDIRKFCEKYLIEKGQPVEVIDLIKSTTQFTDKNLMSLDSIRLNFKNHTSDSQLFFFQNQFVKVTADEIVLQPYKNCEAFVWSDKINNHTILPEKPFFEYYKDENNNDRVKILRTDCEYQNFLINTSRVYWRKELEEQFENDIEAKNKYHNENRFRLNSDYLSFEENVIQDKHYLSKCFALGYLLHKDKRKSFARLVYIMDDKEKTSEEDRNGGSGKSMILDGIDTIYKNRFRIDGMTPNLLNDRFVLDGVTKETDYILIEDLAEYHNITMFYNWITSSLTVNPKQRTPFEIGFFEAPKMALTSNYGLRNAVASTLRRLLFLSTSDYYHNISEDYNEERRVSHDFGHDLFIWDKDSKQPSIHFGFLFQCLQLYLQNRETEIIAPQKNIDLNNVKASIGDVFMEWCESYFVTGSITQTGPGIYEEIKGTLNEYIPRTEMQEAYKQAAGKFAKTSANFKKSLIQYCKLKGWDFNPKDLQGSDGTIKKPFTDKNNKRQIIEHFYIKTHDVEIKEIKAIESKIDSEVQKELFDPNMNPNEPKTDLPF